MHVRIVDGQEVCGRHADGSPRSRTLALQEQLTVNWRWAATEAFAKSSNNRRTWGKWPRWWYIPLAY